MAIIRRGWIKWIRVFAIQVAPPTSFQATHSFKRLLQFKREFAFKISLKVCFKMRRLVFFRISLTGWRATLMDRLSLHQLIPVEDKLPFQWYARLVLSVWKIQQLKRSACFEYSPLNSGKRRIAEVEYSLNTIQWKLFVNAPPLWTTWIDENDF